MDKGFIRTVTELTIANIDDRDFCRNSSYVIYVTSESLILGTQTIEFFSEVKEFDLISALLKTYRSDEEICYNTINVLIKVIVNFSKINNDGDYLRSLFKSRAVEIVGSIMKESKDESLTKLCIIMFEAIKNKCKGLTFFNLTFYFYVTSIYYLGLDKANGFSFSVFCSRQIEESQVIHDKLNKSTGECKNQFH